MFCETEQELELLGKLQRQFPEKHELLLELISWVYINKPERFETIMTAQREGAMDMLELEDFNIESILRNNSKAHILEQIGE